MARRGSPRNGWKLDIARREEVPRGGPGLGRRLGFREQLLFLLQHGLDLASLDRQFPSSRQLTESGLVHRPLDLHRRLHALLCF